MKKPLIIVAGFIAILICAILAHRYVNKTTEKILATNVSVQSMPGENPWNQGIAPKDPWKAIEQMHGHVGPWNVLGWRIGQSALSNFTTAWGRHALDITIYIPMATPFSCMADGLVIGTGNSIGRLDIRLAEVDSMEMICVNIQKKNNEGGTITYKPKIEYLKKILNAPVEELESLSRQCFEMDQTELFEMQKEPQ
jgi:formylmethanofuran dehydrogenase subunit E